jgi:lipoate-protein ligase A
MRLNPDRQLWHQVFSESIPKPPPSLANLSIDDLINTFMQAAGQTFEIELQRQPLSKQEWEEIRAQPSLK